MNKETISKLEKILKTMKLPPHRKTIKSGDSLRWLAKNMQVENALHEHYNDAMLLIKELVK